MYLFFWAGIFSPSTVDCLPPCSAFPQHRQTAVTVLQHQITRCLSVLCHRNLSEQSRTFPWTIPFNSPYIFPYVRMSCWIQITVEEDEKGRFARWECITLVLIVRTLEPISGKSLFLLRSYRLIHNCFPHARLKVILKSSVCTYVMTNA